MYEFYVTIAGARQGPFKGEAGGTHQGKLVGLAFEQDSARPVGSAGRASGKPSFGPVRFTRQWGPASPQFLEALATGEALTTVLFEFLRSNEEGEESVFHTVRLFGARVIGFRPFVELEAEPASLMPLPPLEEVTLAFTGMEVANHLGGTVAMVGTTGTGRAGAKAVAARRPRAAGKAVRRR